MSATPSIIADPKAALRRARELLADDPAAAVSQARELLKASPDNPGLLRVLGAGLRKLGEETEARRAEAAAIRASVRAPGHRQAALAVARGDKAQANAILKRLLADDETDVVALVMLGLQASAVKETDTADALLHKAVALAPGESSPRLALVEHLHKSRRAALALEQLEQLDASASESVQALSLRANVLRDLGRLDEEIALLLKLREMDGSDKYQLRLGHALRNIGRTDEAIEAYRRMIAAFPEEGSAWWSLANLKTIRFSDAEIATMQRGLEAASAPRTNHIRLNFALGKAFEDRGDPGQAYHYYAQGNRLRQEIANYRPDQTSGWVDRVATLYTAEFYAARAGMGCAARDPIFIVGMQRSGSTLVEQILASHSQIEGTAELAEMPNLMREVGDAAIRRGVPLSDYIGQLSADELRSLGQSYLDSTRVHRKQGRPLFTDKMPNNWLYAGFIRLILPNARIVDVRRHPLSCGFSNWKQLYGSGLEHTYSMEWMGQFYAEYVRLMRHIDAVQPGAVHRVVYERLVEDVEGEARRLLDYLDVPFEESVLAFHETERVVRTISAEQVRQPINRKGLDQWHAYEQWLDPLKQGLGATLEDWEQ